MTRRKHNYTEDEIAFLRDNQTMTRQHLTIAFNEKFNTCDTQKAINETCKRRKFKCLNNNRGGNYENFGVVKRDRNSKVVGYERVNKNGFIEVRCAEKTGNGYFRCKHILIWEKHYQQQLPRNHSVVFLDGDSRNFNIDNLMLMHIGAVFQRSRRFADYASAPSDVKPTINLLAKLNYQTTIKGKK
jgi:hypothetical protein